MLSVGAILYMPHNTQYHIIYEINKNYFYTRLIEQSDRGEMCVAHNMNVYPLSYINHSHLAHTDEHTGEHMDIQVGNIYMKTGVGREGYIILTNIDNLGKIQGSSTPFPFFKFSYIHVESGGTGDIILLWKDFSLYFSTLS